jgi:hypothetical protein
VVPGGIVIVQPDFPELKEGILAAAAGDALTR